MPHLLRFFTEQLATSLSCVTGRSNREALNVPPVAEGYMLEV